MTGKRQLLRPRYPVRDSSVSALPETLLSTAIAAQTCVTATYNKGKVKLAPYVLYERDDALFVDAVTLERDGRPPREPKLGAFRLSGLADLSPTSERFQPLSSFAQEEGRPAARIIAQLPAFR